MKFAVPVVVDGATQDLLGLFSLHTTSGPVLIVFTNRVKLRDFLESAANMAASSGQKAGTVELEASSIDALVVKLLAMGLGANEASIIPDSDPLVDELIRQMKT